MLIATSKNMQLAMSNEIFCIFFDAAFKNLNSQRKTTIYIW